MLHHTYLSFLYYRQLYICHLLTDTMYNDHFLAPKLAERVNSNSLRQLSITPATIDFSSNDYLGICTNNLVQAYFKGYERHGSGGARTLTGNYALIYSLEKSIATFHRAEAGLIFNSGYNANLGLMSSVPQKGDTILYDYLAHASLRDGIRLSNANAFKFRHNDLHDLEQKLRNATGNRFVVTESVFSMDGDMAPLQEMVQLCEQYGAHLVVDEAHATGVVGNKGVGLVQHLQLESKVFARVHTFGKAIGTHGAIVLGSEQLKSYLVNFARSFIYTTALPESAITAVIAAYDLFPGMNESRAQLARLSDHFNQAAIPFEKIAGDTTPIKAVIIPGNTAVKAAAAILQQCNLDVRPILYPTVPKGKERLRINLHAFNTMDELALLMNTLEKMA